MFPEYVKCPKSVHSPRGKSNKQPVTFTPDIKESMEDDLTAIMRDRKRYDDLTRSEARRYLNKGKMDHVAYNFLTSHVSSCDPAIR